MSKLILSYEEQTARIAVLERAVIASEGDVERLERELAEAIAAAPDAYGIGVEE